MPQDFINEYIDDGHGKKLEENLHSALEEEKQMKRIVNFFMLALVLIFAMYSIF